MQRPPRRVPAIHTPVVVALAVVLVLALAASVALVVAPAPAPAAGPDGTHRVTGSGRVYVVDPAPEGIEATTRAPEPRLALRRTFSLHSKPGSPRTIYLDVDGATVSGTQWNAPKPGLPAGAHPAWDPAGNGPSFSAGELATVQDVWARVAEDYAPFDVDVTTADPGVAALTRSGRGDEVFGTRVLITPSDEPLDVICGGACGGVAFLDVFDEPDFHSLFQPAWVFPQAMGDDPKAIAEAVSHEVGHTFGLDHDGRAGKDYYTGHGSWAPIMGIGYGRPITQWSQGAYALATRPGQDDVAVIAANGAPYRADEDGGSRATASSSLPTSAPAYISRRSDVDFYALGTCSGTVRLTGTVAAVSPDLDLQVQLVDEVGAVLAQADPASAAVGRDVATGLGASLTQRVPPGTYFAVVDGVGNGSPSIGYDDYGSLGAYRLAVTGCGLEPVIPGQEPPGAPTSLVATRDVAARTVGLAWAAPVMGDLPAGYEVRIDAGPWTVAAGPFAHTFSAVSGATHTLGVRATGALGAGLSAGVPVAALRGPRAPAIGRASPGARGGASTALARWRPPVDAGGSPVNGYRVSAYRLNSAGRVVRTFTSPALGAGLRTVALRLPAGRYRFAVRARTLVGFGPLSARSAAVTAR